MFINSVGYFIPETRISNDYFLEVTGLNCTKSSYTYALINMPTLLILLPAFAVMPAATPAPRSRAYREEPENRMKKTVIDFQK